MRHSLTLISGLAYALLLAGSAAPATPPPAPTALLRSSGKVLILENDRTLVGDVERQGDQLHIRQAVGEMWLPTSRVKYIAESWDDVYNYMAARTSRHDPRERLQLAQWCAQQGMHEHARKVAELLLEQQPKYRPVQQFLSMLKHVKTPPPATAPATADLLHQEPPPLDLTNDALGVFVTKVQPILMNTCMSCHGSEHRGTFKLLRVSPGGVTSRRATQINVAAVMAHVNVERPALSAILLKAVSIHDSTSAKPPLPGRQSVPYLLLHSWVEGTLYTNPHLREQRAAAEAVKAPPSAPLPTAEKPVFGSDTSAPPPVPLLTERAAPLVVSTPAVTAPRPVETPPVPTGAPPLPRGKTAPALPVAAPRPAPPPAAEPLDEFDPSQFNQKKKE